MTRTEKALLGVFPALAAANLCLLTTGDVRLVVGHVSLIAAPALAAAACLRAGRRGALRASPTWLLIAAGAALVAVGQAIWFTQQLILRQPLAFPSLSFYLFLAFHPLFAIGVLRSLRLRGRSEPPVDLALDAMLASAAIAVIMIRYLHEPLRAMRPWLTYGEVSWIVGGQFLAQLSLVAVGVLIIWRRSMLSPGATAGLAAVAAVNALANLLQMASLDPDPGSPGDAFDLTWLLGWALLTWAGLAGSSTGAGAWSGRAASSLSRLLRQSIAPVATVVLAVLTVDIAARDDGGAEIVIASSLLGLLLAARMFRAVGASERENRDRRELERTRILVELSHTFAAAPRVEDALAHVLTSAQRLLSARRVWIERIGSDAALRIHSSDSADTIPPYDMATGAWLDGRRFAQKLTGDHDPSSGPDGEILNARLWLAAADIRFGHRNAGTLVAERDDAGFDADELEMLGALADQAALAIENARLLDEARLAERERLRNEKLVSLGNVVAGVAHEINNPLTAIQSAADLIAREMPQDCDPEVLGILRTETIRAAAIVRRMLDFVRPVEIRTTAIDTGEVVEAALRVRAPEHDRAGIRTRVQLHGLPAVLAERCSLHQVITNLIINAEHAMVGSSGERSLDISGTVEATMVRIDVRDRGCGIPAERIERVFDPFFTTKAPGAGTGLGLSVSHGIVREFGGTITVESSVGTGSIFTVRLPIAPASIEDEPAPAASIAERASGAARSILLVEDEASIRMLASRYMRQRGYEVETAENGRAALALLERRTYDVVVTDLRMPDVGGEELYSRLYTMNVAQARRVLFISGDTVADGTREFLLRTGRPFISKPFELDALAGRINEVIASACAHVVHRAS